jgi:hypothetical protein
MPDADAGALLSRALLSGAVTRSGVFEAGLGVSGIAVGVLLTCAALVATAHTKVETTHNNFILFSNFRQSAASGPKSRGVSRSGTELFISI